VADRDEALAELYQHHHGEAVRLAWALCRDASLAEELAQEAFVRLYLRRRALRDPAAAPAYLRRIVVNLVYDHTRRSARERDLATSRASTVVGDREGDLDLLDALSGLPERRRACVVLRYYLDLTEVETAAALGISVGTVKSQTHKALAQLRRNLTDEERPVTIPVAAPEPMETPGAGGTED
jgi:RNA polymerase sigma-70 factor (sigma-E family)